MCQDNKEEDTTICWLEEYAKKLKQHKEHNDKQSNNN